MAAAGNPNTVTWHLQLKLIARKIEMFASEIEESSPEISVDSPSAEKENIHPHGRDFLEVGNLPTGEGNKQGVVSGEQVDTLISKLSNLLLKKPPDSRSQEKESHGGDGVAEGSGNDPRRGPRTVSEVEGDQGVDQNDDGQSRVTASEVEETSQIDDTHPALLASRGDLLLTMKRERHEEELPQGIVPLRKLRAVSVVDSDQVGDQNYVAHSELTASEVGWSTHIDRTHSGSPALMDDSPPKVYTFGIGSKYTHGVGSAFDEASGKWKEFIMVPAEQGDDQDNGAQSALTASEGEGSSHMDAHSGLLQSTNNLPSTKRKWHEEESNRTAGSDPRPRPRTGFVVDERDEGGDQNYGGQFELTASEVGWSSHIDCAHSGSPALMDASPPKVYAFGIGSKYTHGVGSAFDEASGKWKEFIMVPADQGDNQNNGVRALEPNQRSLLRTKSFSSVTP